MVVVTLRHLNLDQVSFSHSKHLLSRNLAKFQTRQILDQTILTLDQILQTLYRIILIPLTLDRILPTLAQITLTLDQILLTLVRITPTLARIILPILIQIRLQIPARMKSIVVLENHSHK